MSMIDRCPAISSSPNYTDTNDSAKDSRPQIIQQGYRYIVAEIQDLHATMTGSCDESNAKGYENYGKKL